MNIPIYRAKKIGSDEYVYGYYTERVHHYPGRHYIHFHNGSTATYERIDLTTIAIHFPNMTDSQGNKIFASLQEDGKGGDIMQDDEYIGIAKYIDCQFVVEYENCIDNIDNGNFDVIGIQE